MNFLRTQLFTLPLECVVLATQNPEIAGHAFKSFTLHGADDCPAQLDLYASVSPEYNERPVAVFRRDGDTLILDAATPTKARK